MRDFKGFSQDVGKSRHPFKWYATYQNKGVQMKCPTDWKMAAYLDEKLSYPSKTQIEAHLEKCRRCHELVEMKRVFDQTPEIEVPTDFVPNVLAKLGLLRLWEENPEEMRSLPIQIDPKSESLVTIGKSDPKHFVQYHQEMRAAANGAETETGMRVCKRVHHFLEFPLPDKAGQIGIHIVALEQIEVELTPHLTDAGNERIVVGCYADEQPFADSYDIPNHTGKFFSLTDGPHRIFVDWKRSNKRWLIPLNIQ